MINLLIAASGHLNTHWTFLWKFNKTS